MDKTMTTETIRNLFFEQVKRLSIETSRRHHTLSATAPTMTEVSIC